MKYKRLTKRNRNGYISLNFHSEYKDIELHKLKDRLTELEDKIEQGTLIELPCKVDDTVYFETYMGSVNVGICGHKVVGFKIDALVKRNGAIIATEIPIAKFGESVFLSKEEAEAKLEELRG